MDTFNTSYNLHPDFENVVLWYCATNRKFWSRIGHELEIELLDGPFAKDILQACREIAKDTNHGPDGILIVVEHLQSKVRAGKFTAQRVNDIYDLLDHVQDSAEIPDIDATIGVLVPTVRKHIQQQAISSAHQDFAKDGDYSVPRGLLDKAHRLGEEEKVLSLQLGPKGFDAIRESQDIARLSTGIMELDLAIGGGLLKKGVGVWVGEPGAGKSIALVTGACEALRNQLFVGVASLELSATQQISRIYANLVGLPTNDIAYLDSWRIEAQRRFEMIQSGLGVCEIGDFPPQATSVQDLIDWIEDKEQELGRKMDALFVDYGTKMFAPGIRLDNTYLTNLHVFEGMRRDIADARDMWVWSAAQAKGRDSKKRLDMRDIADSMHIARVVDLVLTLNRDEETGLLEIFVAKDRHGKDRFTVGPLFTEYERARIVPVTQELGDW